MAQKRGAPSFARSRQSAARSGGAGQRKDSGSRPVKGDELEEELEEEELPPPLVSAASAASSGSRPEESAARQARSPLAPSSRAAWASAPETLDLFFVFVFVFVWIEGERERESEREGFGER